jgi:hypothetical protein
VEVDSGIVNQRHLDCDHLHFRYTGASLQNKKFEVWDCIDCGMGKLLKGTVFNWVGMSGGKWRCKKRFTVQ